MTIDYDSYSSGYDDGVKSLLSKLDEILYKWKQESKYREEIASEDWVSNTLNDCVDDIEKLIEGERNEF